MGNDSELRVDMAYCIRKHIRRGTDFTIRDLCDACDLSFDKRADVQKVYTVILNWREISKNRFNAPATTALIEKHGTAEAVWDAFLNRLNKENIFLLFSMRNADGKATYYQPSWVEKESLDFTRMRRQLSGHLTILVEMDQYGENFPEIEGVLLSPKELALEMAETLGKAQLKLDRAIENKIKELESAGDDNE